MLTRRSLAPLVPLVGVLALSLAACGDDDDDASSDATSVPAAADAPAAADVPAGTAAPASTVPAVTTMDHQMVNVDGVDYDFENLPASVPAGTMLQFTNTSTVELHELVAMRIPDDETRPVSELVALPEEEIGAIMGDALPAVVIIAPPGEVGTPVVGDGSLTEPGRYAVLCAIPVGADPAEFMAAVETEATGPPTVDGGPPHFTEGMFTELVVEPA